MRPQESAKTDAGTASEAVLLICAAFFLYLKRHRNKEISFGLEGKKVDGAGRGVRKGLCSLGGVLADGDGALLE